MTDGHPTAPNHLAAAAGLLLAMSFFGLSQTPAGLQYDFHGPWNRIPAAELQFWLGFVTLFLPGMGLVGYSVWPTRWPSLKRAATAATGLSDGAFRRLLAAGATVFIGISVGLRHFVLRGFPLTDDENAVRFGGKLLASGRAWAEAPPLIESMPNAYLYLWEGKLASFDWLGSQIAWALAELTGFAWPWPLLSAAALVACAWVARQEVGHGYGVAAGFILVASPMFLTLSMTTHAHVLSRGFVALFLAAWVVARDRGSIGHWFIAGAMVGAAALCRPFESAALLSPFAIYTAYALLRRESWAKNAVIGMGIALVFPAVAWLVHQHAITEVWGSTTRSASTPSEIPWRIIPIPATASFTDPMRLWSRFGGNFAYNLLMLVVFFGGPIGAVLAAIGSRASLFAKLLSLGVVVQLALALFHDDAGIHAVGPIHYSEVAPWLAILAAFGLKRVFEVIGQHDFDARPAITAATVAFVVGSVLFSAWMMVQLRRQADVQAAVWEVVKSADLKEPALVLTPEFHQIFKHHPDWNRTAAWVLRWPPASPGAVDPTIFVHSETVSSGEARSAYPDRNIYRITLLDSDPWVELQPEP